MNFSLAIKEDMELAAMHKEVKTEELINSEDTKIKNAYTKPAQFKILSQFMEEHSDLARGKLNTVKGKTTAANLWKRLSESLNAAGPPAREVVGWKKVWADYKNHSKVKLQKENKSIAQTNNGPSQCSNLHQIEENVGQLLSMDEAVQGTSGTQSFGVAEVCEVLKELPVEISAATKNLDYDMNFQKETSTSLPQRSRSVPTLGARDELLKKQVENQISYQEGSIRKLDEICNTLKDISETLKITKDIKERKLQLCKRKFEHQKETDLKKLKLKTLELQNQILDL